MVRKVVLKAVHTAGYGSYYDALRDFVESCYWEEFNNYIENIIHDNEMHNRTPKVT